MGQFNWRKKFAIEKQYNETIGKDIPHSAGIYLWTRKDADITYFYVGQAKDINKRRFDYYSIQCGLSYPTRHFEASLKKHKDWEFMIIELCAQWSLDDREQYWIKHYLAQPNFITRNELLAGKDIVKSNSKRIDQVIKKYENKLIKLLKKCNVWNNNELKDMPNTYSNEICIYPKENKNGEINKNSQNAFNELSKWLKGLIENDKANN